MERKNPAQPEAPPLASEINEQVSPLLKKLTENLKQIGLIFGAIILVAAVITGYRYYRMKTLENAQAKWGHILIQDEPEQRITNLQAFLPEAPNALQPAIRLQIASQALKHGDYDLAAASWKTIAANHPDQELETIARIGLAEALHLQGQTGQALDILKQLQQKAPEAFKQNILYALAAMAESNRDWAASVQAYEQLKSESDVTGTNSEYIDHKITQLQQKIQQGKSS
jgi:predicted negative regulator of RcsB-dependent stress response